MCLLVKTKDPSLLRNDQTSILFKEILCICIPNRAVNACLNQILLLLESQFLTQNQNRNIILLRKENNLNVSITCQLK